MSSNSSGPWCEEAFLQSKICGSNITCMFALVLDMCIYHLKQSIYKLKQSIICPCSLPSERFLDCRKTTFSLSSTSATTNNTQRDTRGESGHQQRQHFHLRQASWPSDQSAFRCHRRNWHAVHSSTASQVATVLRSGDRKLNDAPSIL